jgi:hypothetical protein
MVEHLADIAAFLRSTVRMALARIFPFKSTKGHERARPKGVPAGISWCDLWDELHLRSVAQQNSASEADNVSAPLSFNADKAREMGTKRWSKLTPSQRKRLARKARTSDR